MKKTRFAAMLYAILVSPCALATPVPFTDTTPGASTFVVSQSGLYQITAIGAEGGSGNGHSGGLGGSITGDFYLMAGDLLSLLVGGVGGSGSAGGGGGGGTFVMLGSIPFVVAGGGGGANTGGSGLSASLTTSGVSSDGPGGTAGSGGGSIGSGSGGGGLLTDGADGYSTNGGKAYVNGGAGGGSSACCGASGGVGGGGGANNYGGGGGGYSGGGGGNGGGGGSFDGGLADANFSEFVLTTAVNGGNGEVTIALLRAAAATVPEPGSIFVFGIGGIALLASRRQRSWPLRG